MIVCTFKALKHERVSLKTTLSLNLPSDVLNWSWTDPGTVWVCLVDLISSELMNLTDFSRIVCSDGQCFSCGSRWLCCFCCGASEPFLWAETSWSPVSRVLNPPQSLWPEPVLVESSCSRIQTVTWVKVRWWRSGSVFRLNSWLMWEETRRTKFWPMKLFLDENSHTQWVRMMFETHFSQINNKLNEEELKKNNVEVLLRRLDQHSAVSTAVL